MSVKRCPPAELERRRAKRGDVFYPKFPKSQRLVHGDELKAIRKAAKATGDNRTLIAARRFIARSTGQPTFIRQCTANALQWLERHGLADFSRSRLVISTGMGPGVGI